MCHKNQIVCSTSILKFSWLKCDKSKSSAKYHKILMSRFWKNVFCVPLLFCRHVCLSNLKHAPSLELLLTAHKTVFSHLNWGTLFNWYDNYVFDLQYGSLLFKLEVRASKVSKTFPWSIDVSQVLFLVFCRARKTQP